MIFNQQYTITGVPQTCRTVAFDCTTLSTFEIGDGECGRRSWNENIRSLCSDSSGFTLKCSMKTAILSGQSEKIRDILVQSFQLSDEPIKSKFIHHLERALLPVVSNLHGTID